MKFIRLFVTASAVFFYGYAAIAQTSGTTTKGAFAIGKGAGGSSFTSLLCGSAQLAVGQAAADPICRTLTGDVTLNAAGVTAIGASKVTNSMLAGSIAASKLIGTDISTVGTITTGVWNGTAVPVLNGGTGATTAANARSNLGLAIGSNVQAWDADLDCLAALSGTGILRRTGAGTCSNGTTTLVAEGGTGGSVASGTLLDNISGFSGTGFLTRTGTGTYVFQSTTNGITNSNLSQVGAATIKGNPTSSTANVSDFTIQGLTARGSPDATNDKIPLYDNAAGTIKYVTPGQIAASATAGVSLYNGRSGSVTAIDNDVPVRGYLSGLEMSPNNGSNFGISAGVATDTTSTFMMKLSSAYLKTGASWAVGSNVGALDTGTIGTGFYHVHLIRRPDTGVVDVLISLSATSPTLPTNYTQFRRIGSVKYAGGAFIKLVQSGDTFLMDVSTTDVNVTNLGNTAVLYPLSVPTGVKVDALFRAYMSNSTAASAGILTSPDESDQAVSGAVFDFYISTSGAISATSMQRRTDTSGQIRARSNTANMNLGVATFGWIDRRGRDN